MLKLKEAIDKKDNNKVVSSLISLRQLSKNNQISRETFALLIDLIKVPNSKVINYTLSILGNCCCHNSYRCWFKEMGGVTHLLLVTKIIDNESIICRACRLIGNLAMNSDLAKELAKNDAGIILMDLLENFENMTTSTQIMILRAIKKLSTVTEYKRKMLPYDLLSTFKKCLNSEDVQIVRLSIETLMMLTNLKEEKSDRLKVSKELFLKIIELSKEKELNHLALLYLSNIICRHSYVWNYLEGSNIAETFIDHMQKVNNIDGGVYKAFYKLCREGAVRNKVRNANLLPRLINLCTVSNVKKLLAILYLFQYDLVSMMVCSQNPKFISILIKNVLIPGAVPLLAVLSRLNPPVKELVLEENLEVFIQNKECIGILKNITQTREFLKPLLTSGKVWKIEKAGCSMEEIGSLGYSEGLLINLLGCGEKKCIEDVSLAIPFLIKPRNFELLYKLLAHYQVIPTILNLLQENPTDEGVLASVIRLINIFRHNYHQSDTFFQDFGEFIDPVTAMDVSSDNGTDNAENPCETEIEVSNVEIVTFELDNGNCVDVNKNLLCKNSPVLNSMLNGHFMEANQKKVKLRRCSKEALLRLTKLLNGESDLSEIDIETYLELLSLTDRFLLISLSNILTENLKIDADSCPLVYQWYRSAGYTKNNAIVRQKIYEFLFSSSEYLLQAMKHESCRTPLVSEISNYLSNSLMDLL